MPIKASAARQIEVLIANLGSDRADVREAAVARLTLVGARAVDRLLLLLDASAPVVARAAALRTLEAIADPRALERVLETLESPDAAVASAAAGAARVFLRGARGAAAVDRLASVALDTAREDVVRIAAIRALDDLDPATIAPLLEAVRRDPNDVVRMAATPTSTAAPVDMIVRAADFGLPEDPVDLGQALGHAGADVSLPLVLRIIERVREREAAEPTPRKDEWMRVRGRAHVMLADRGSRIALYDLRESIEAAARPLPVEFLAALATAGDASCLEAIAAAYSRAMPAAATVEDEGRWWRDHLADAFQLIVHREGLTRGHAQMKKIEKRWGLALDQLWAGAAGGAGRAGGTRKAGSKGPGKSRR